MIIGCCDFQMDISTVFDAPPEHLYLLRNVANLVPPYEPDTYYHGTSSALEFAISLLDIKHIIVLGHSDCIGIQALLRGAVHTGQNSQFVANWISMIQGVEKEVTSRYKVKLAELEQRAVEKSSILHSIDNLMTFPFVHERVERSQLVLHGWYFDQDHSAVEVYDPTSKEFEAVQPKGSSGFIISHRRSYRSRQRASRLRGDILRTLP